MKVALLQFASHPGDVDDNIHRADAVLGKEDQTELAKVDLLVLPELAFTGSDFDSREHAHRYLERPGSGVSSLWARTAALKYGCAVVAGYPEKFEASKTNGIANTEQYNSAIVLNGRGETVSSYRKHVLSPADEVWASRGAGSFQDIYVPGLGRVVVALSTDLNPRPFKDTMRYELAEHILESNSRLVIIPMSWAAAEAESGANQRLGEPDMATLNLWIRQLEPVVKAKRREEIIIAFCNRARSTSQVQYSGTSAVLGIKSGEVVVYGLLDQSSEQVLLVDTEAAPFSKLTQPTGEDNLMELERHGRPALLTPPAPPARIKKTKSRDVMRAVMTLEKIPEEPSRPEEPARPSSAPASISNSPKSRADKVPSSEVKQSPPVRSSVRSSSLSPRRRKIRSPRLQIPRAPSLDELTSALHNQMLSPAESVRGHMGTPAPETPLSAASPSYPDVDFSPVLSAFGAFITKDDVTGSLPGTAVTTNRTVSGNSTASDSSTASGSSTDSGSSTLTSVTVEDILQEILDLGDEETPTSSSPPPTAWKRITMWPSISPTHMLSPTQLLSPTAIPEPLAITTRAPNLRLSAMRSALNTNAPSPVKVSPANNFSRNRLSRQSLLPEEAVAALPPVPPKLQTTAIQAPEVPAKNKLRGLPRLSTSATDMIVSEYLLPELPKLPPIQLCETPAKSPSPPVNPTKPLALPKRTSSLKPRDPAPRRFELRAKAPRTEKADISVPETAEKAETFDPKLQLPFERRAKTRVQPTITPVTVLPDRPANPTPSRDNRPQEYMGHAVTKSEPIISLFPKPPSRPPRPASLGVKSVSALNLAATPAHTPTVLGKLNPRPIIIHSTSNSTNTGTNTRPSTAPRLHIETAPKEALRSGSPSSTSTSTTTSHVTPPTSTTSSFSPITPTEPPRLARLATRSFSNLISRSKSVSVGRNEGAQMARSMSTSRGAATLAPAGLDVARPKTAVAQAVSVPFLSVNKDHYGMERRAAFEVLLRGGVGGGQGLVQAHARMVLD